MTVTSAFLNANCRPKESLVGPENRDFGKGAMLVSMIVMGMMYGLLTEAVISGLLKAKATQ